MGGVSVVDLIAIGPIVLGTILWRFLPPEGTRSVTRRRRGWRSGGGPDGEQVESAASCSMPSSPRPRSSTSDPRAGGREAVAPHDGPTWFVRVSPPTRPSYRVGAACILAPHVLHR
jgi:hypothetical protein